MLVIEFVSGCCVELCNRCSMLWIFSARVVQLTAMFYKSHKAPVTFHLEITRKNRVYINGTYASILGAFNSQFYRLFNVLCVILLTEIE